MDKDNSKDIDYTIVLDPRYPSLDAQEQAEAETKVFAKPGSEALKGSEEAVQDAKAKAGAEQEKDEQEAAIDRLYDEYEKMCYKESTAVDKDDAYPHSYQWRIGDRYDEAKVAVLREALKERKLIADTEAYLIYVEEIKSRSFRPESWD
ncbi:MAG: hypothetical protein IKF70_01045 [Firmicutes bacterium]|nr:hypothetical protein [Bacillota bacterium]